jgi:DNA polymerase III epsilon subunit-like protein
VAELVPHPHVQGADGLDVLRSHQRPRTTHVIVWDTETTGREHDARIVEIAAARVRLADGAVESMWSQLVNPGCRIPREVSQIHGIDDAAVRGAPSIAQVLPVFLRGCVQHALPLVAHNAVFDLARVTYEAQRSDVALPGTLSVHCSLEASRALHRTTGHKLSVVAQRYGVVVADAHRAEGDVRMLAGVLPHLLRRPDAQGRDFRDVFPLKAML